MQTSIRERIRRSGFASQTALGAVLAVAVGYAVFLFLRQGEEAEGGGGQGKVVPLRGGPQIDSAGTITNSSEEKKFGNPEEDGRDVIEEASWESFPASDPPAW